MKTRALSFVLVLTLVGAVSLVASVPRPGAADAKPAAPAKIARDLHICPYCNNPYPGEIKNGKFVFDNHKMVEMPMTETQSWVTCQTIYFSIIKAMAEVGAGELIEYPPAPPVNPSSHSVSI